MKTEHIPPWKKTFSPKKTVDLKEGEIFQFYDSYAIPRYKFVRNDGKRFYYTKYRDKIPAFVFDDFDPNQEWSDSISDWPKVYQEDEPKRIET